MEKLKVIFKIHNSIYSHDELNDKLSTNATNSWCKGETIGKGKFNLRQRNTTWQLEFNNSTNELKNDLNILLCDALAFIKGKEKEIKIISEAADLELVIVAYLAETVNFGFFLEKEVLKTLSLLDVEVDVDIYYLRRNK